MNRKDDHGADAERDSSPEIVLFFHHIGKPRICRFKARLYAGGYFSKGVQKRACRCQQQARGVQYTWYHTSICRFMFLIYRMVNSVHNELIQRYVFLFGCILYDGLLSLWNSNQYIVNFFSQVFFIRLLPRRCVSAVCTHIQIVTQNRTRT